MKKSTAKTAGKKRAAVAKRGSAAKRTTRKVAAKPGAATSKKATKKAVIRKKATTKAPSKPKATVKKKATSKKKTAKKIVSRKKTATKAASKPKATVKKKVASKKRTAAKGVSPKKPAKKAAAKKAASKPAAPVKKRAASKKKTAAKQAVLAKKAPVEKTTPKSKDTAPARGRTLRGRLRPEKSTRRAVPSNRGRRADGKLSAKTLKLLRAVLLALHAELTGQAKALKTASLRREDDVYSPEDGSDVFERIFGLSVASSELDSVFEIEEALRRMDDGTYGLCEVCEGKISVPRLEAVPFVRTCIECQSAIEKGKIHYRPI